MTADQAESLSVFLRAMGFRDTGSDHAWNILSFEKAFGPLKLTVWGRDHQGPFVQIAYPETQAFLESISLKEVAA